MSRLIGIVIIILIAGLAVDRYIPLSQLWYMVTGRSHEACRIKGNINRDGQRIYHVPGDRWYDHTRVDRLQGERWFCSEAEARAAGWRKAR